MKRSGRALLALLLGALLVVQLAAPVAATPRPEADAGSRLAGLALVVGHAVAICHHDGDGSKRPADGGGSCCPCVLCHALTAACLAAPVEFAVVRPSVVVGGVAAYPQPPPHKPAIVSGLSGPRGPPSLL